MQLAPFLWIRSRFVFISLPNFQLPCRTGPQNTHSRINEEQCKACLIQISRHRFSLVISGLTKILQRVNESVFCGSSFDFIIVERIILIVQFFQFLPACGGNVSRPHASEFERSYYESLIIVLDTLEKCLSSQPKDTTKFDEAMNVKLLLREICQFIGTFSPFCIVTYLNVSLSIVCFKFKMFPPITKIFLCLNNWPAKYYSLSVLIFSMPFSIEYQPDYR